MPGLDYIQNEINTSKQKGQDIIRKKYLLQLSEYTERDTIVYASDFTSTKIISIPASTVSITTEDLQGFMSANKGLKRKKLDLILHSPGGSPEASEQIVQYLRSKYQNIRVIIPQNAMSTAAMLSCAADEIIMGKHSALGPIDPQITFPTSTGQFTAPAHTIISEFEQAKEEVEMNPKIASLWMAKVQNIPFGLLQYCKTSIALSEEKVTKWLELYMFKEDKDKGEKAKDIASWLADYKTHKTHGKPISFSEAHEKGLNVKPLEDDKELQDNVLSVYHAVLVTFQTSNCLKLIENHNGHGWYLMASIQPPQIPIR
jgi:hypothetical protein